MSENTQERRLAAVASISDPLRRSLFDLVAASDDPVSRDDAAVALGMARGTAAFHLDRLVDDGVLVVEFKRLSGKTGPGSGRPSKLYRRASEDLLVSVPERHYELAGEIMATAIEESTREGTAIDDALHKVARETGETIGAQTGSLERVLIATGYEPRPDGEGGFDFNNCPFHGLARSHTHTICGLNGRFLEGALSGAQDSDHCIEAPLPGARCCARISLLPTATDAKSA